MRQKDAPPECQTEAGQDRKFSERNGKWYRKSERESAKKRRSKQKKKNASEIRYARGN